MDAENITNPPENQIPEQKMSALLKILKIFYEPSSVFKCINRKLDWIMPLIVIAIIGGLVGYFSRPIIAVEQGERVKEGMEKYRDQMPQDRFEEIMSRIDDGVKEAVENPFKWYYPLIGLAFPLVMSLVISGICIIAGNFLFGGKCNFWLIMGAITYAALIGLLGDAVRGLMMIMKETSAVYTGLGLLKPINDGSFLHYLLIQIDIFTIWRIIVTALGLGILYKMKPVKFTYVLFPIWIIFILLVALGNSTIMMGGIIY